MNSTTLIIQATSICNCNCSYCYDYPRRKGHRIMALETLRNVIQKASKYGITKFLWHGGEPLLAGLSFYENVISIQNEFYKHDHLPKNLIQTNGISLDAKFCDFLVKNNFKIGISIDGVNEHSNFYRYGGRSKEFTKVVLNAIERLKDQNTPIGILAVLHENSLPYLNDLYDRFSNSKCVIKFAPIINMGKAKSQSFNGNMDSLLIQFMYPVVKRYFLDNKKVFRIDTFDDAFKINSGLSPKTCSLTDSCVGKFFCVTTEGDLYPCSRTAANPRYHLGNISATEFEECNNELLHLNTELFCDIHRTEQKLSSSLSSQIKQIQQDNSCLSKVDILNSEQIIRKNNFIDKQAYAFSSHQGCNADHADYVAYSDAVDFYDDKIALLESVKKSDFDLHAILLYTEADLHICKWAREHGELLHKLSGRLCRVIVPERAALPKNNSALFIPELKDDENRSIKYARLLGVKETKIPCFAFFDKSMPENIMIYHFDPEWEGAKITYVMKSVFENIYSAHVDLSFGENPFESLMKRLKRTRLGIVVKYKTDKSSVFDLLKLFVPFLK